MLHKTLSRVAGALMFVALFVFIGCSDDQENDTGVINEITQNIVDSVVDHVVDAEFASDKLKAELIAEKNVTVDNFIDMVVVDSVVYAIFEGGLLVYDLAEDTYEAIGAGEKLNAIALHEGEIYVGGKNLFKVADAGLGKVTIGENMLKPINPALESIALHFDDGITSLESFDGALIIGTNRGLFSKTASGFESLRDDIPVTALTSDEDGLWVGTDGKGLFRVQDGKFHKRFLIRDTSIFDNINCLDYNRGYVYVGTNDAFYIFDGGSWETLTTENGMPSSCVTNIDADGWVIYIATDAGVISYFNGDFLPVKKLDTIPVNGFGRWEGKMLVGTNDALMLKSRAGLRTLVESDLIDAREPAFVEEVIEETDPAKEDMYGPLLPDDFEMTAEPAATVMENSDPDAENEVPAVINENAETEPIIEEAPAENEEVGFDNDSSDEEVLTQKPTDP